MADAGRFKEITDAISSGEQPDMLANLDLANQIANINLAQQQILAVQQEMRAMFHLWTIAFSREIPHCTRDGANT